MGWAGALAPIYWLLGVRVVLASNALLSRRCWCVGPLDPCHRPGHHAVTSSSRQCGHVIIVLLAGNHCPYALTCRSALLVGHVGHPWLCGLFGQVVGIVVAVPEGGWSSCVRDSSLLTHAGRAPALSAAWALSATFPHTGLNNANTPIPHLPRPTWPLLIHREHGDPGP